MLQKLGVEGTDLVEPFQVVLRMAKHECVSRVEDGDGLVVYLLACPQDEWSIYHNPRLSEARPGDFRLRLERWHDLRVADKAVLIDLSPYFRR